MNQNAPNRNYQILIRPNVEATVSKCEGWIRQVSDKSQPAYTRIEAVENIGRECQEHQIFQRLGWIVDTEEDDAAVRGAIVRILPQMGTPVRTACHRAGAPLPGVRAAAVETLDRMAQVTAEKESRLASELASLRSGVADPIRVSALPTLYGRTLAPQLSERIDANRKSLGASFGGLRVAWSRRSRNGPRRCTGFGATSPQESCIGNRPIPRTARYGDSRAVT